MLCDFGATLTINRTLVSLNPCFNGICSAIYDYAVVPIEWQ